MAVLIRMSHIEGVEDEACFHSRSTGVDISSVPIVSVVHIVNCAQCEGEYTLCGCVWTDSSLRSEGFERLGDPFKGSVKNVLVFLVCVYYIILKVCVRSVVYFLQMFQMGFWY